MILPRFFRSLAVTFAFTTAHAFSFAASAPVAFYPAEGNGDDLAGSHHQAQVSANANAHFAAGKVGQALHFADTNYVDLGNWFTVQSFSVAMWVKAAAAQIDAATIMHYSTDEPGVPLLWKISYRASDQKYLYESADGGAAIAFTLGADAWHYLAITRDGRTRATNVYVDGTLAGSAQGTSDISYDFASGIRLGATRNLTNYWAGDLDELRFYDRAITLVEIAQLAAPGVDVTVMANMNPFLAGLPNGASASGGDSAPAQSPLQVTGISVAGGQRLRFSAAGSVEHVGGLPTEAPDGLSDYSRSGENGIAGVTYPLDSLVGVFLDDSLPTDSPAPANSDNTGFNSVENFTPGLKQIFAIGDGVTNANALQTFAVPVGATRLFLGTTDGSGWFNNLGALGVHIVNLDAAPVGNQLPSVALQITGSVSAGMPIQFGATTASGLAVRVQSSTMPAIEASWTDLPDGHGGAMTESATPGIYSLTTTYYPAGTAVSFRAIAAKPGFTDSISNVLGTFALQHAQLSLFAKISTTTDSSGATARVGDRITYTFTVVNDGAAPAQNVRIVDLLPTYLNAQNQPKQIEIDKVPVSLISSGGQLIDTLDPFGAAAKAVAWNVGSLVVGEQQSVSYVVVVAPTVRIDSQIHNNVYSVVSTSAQPPTGADSTGHPLETTVRSPIRVQLTADAQSVAPGGLITYTFTLTNLASYVATHPTIIDPIPEHARLVAAGMMVLDRHGNPVLNGLGKPRLLSTGVARGVVNGHDSVIFHFGSMKPREVRKAQVIVQVQFIDPAQLPQVANIDYTASFLDPRHARISTNGDKTNNDVLVALQGAVVDPPKLQLLKAISDSRSGRDEIHTEEQPDGDLLNTVEPGREITFALGLVNRGGHAAEEVFVQDRLPEHTVLKPGSVQAVLISPRGSRIGHLAAARLDSGRTLRLSGLRLDPGVIVWVQYTVTVLAAGSDAPASGDILLAGASSIGSASIPSTPAGFPAEIPIKVIGHPFFRIHTSTLVAHPTVSVDPSQTAAALNTIYATDANALPATADGKYLPGVQRYYLHYENAGTLAGRGVQVKFPLPANTVFYRSSFVRPTGRLDVLPAGGRKTDPAVLSSGGIVNFSFARLAPGEEGDVMIEVIIDGNAINAGGSFVEAQPEIFDSTFTPMRAPFGRSTAAALFPPRRTVATLKTTPCADLQHVPRVGIAKTVPTSIAPGSNFQITVVVANYGDVGCHPIVEMEIPGNCEWVSTDAGQSISLEPSANGPGNLIGAVLASNNGPVLQGDTEPLRGHSAAAVTFTFHATGLAGTSIDDATAYARVDYLGKLTAAPTSTAIIAPNPLQSPGGTIVTVFNTDHALLPNGGLVIPLGAGQIVAQGGGNIISTNGGGIISTNGGGIVASGAGNAITINNVGLLGNLSGSAVLSGLANIVAQGGGNIFNTGAGNLISQDGASLISNDGGSVLTTVASIVAQGGGNIVAQGGGNIVAQGGGNIVAQGGGNIVAQGGGNLAGSIYTIGGAIVAQGGGNIVAQGGGNIVASGAGNFGISLADSTATIVAQGGGNIVASGAGNLTSGN